MPETDSTATAVIRDYYESLEIEGEPPRVWVSTFDGFHWLSDGHFGAKLIATGDWHVDCPRNGGDWPEIAASFFRRAAGATPVATAKVPKFAPPKPEWGPCGCRRGACECHCGNEHECQSCRGTGGSFFYPRAKPILVHPKLPPLGDLPVARALAFAPSEVELRVSDVEDPKGRCAWFVSDGFLAGVMERRDDGPDIGGAWEVAA